MVIDRNVAYFFYITLVILLLGLPVRLISQTNGKSVEELSLEYEQATNDSIKWASLSSLVSAYARVNPDTAVILGEQALAGAKNTNLRTVEGNALLSLGEAYDIGGDYARAIEYFDEGLALFLELKNDAGITRAYNSRGLAHQYGGYADLAREDYELAIVFAKKEKDFVFQAKIYHNLGLAYAAHSDYHKSLESYLLARNLKDSLVGNNVLGLTARDQISTHTNLGALYQELLQFDMARESYSAALDLTKEEPLRRLVILYNLGTIEERDSNYVEAEELYQQSLQIAQDNNFLRRQAFIFDGLGNTYRDQGIMERAGTFYQQALALLKDYPNPVTLGKVLNNEGIMFVRQGDFLKGKANGIEALELGNVTGDQMVTLYAHDLLARAAEGLNDQEQASEHLRAYVDLKQVLDNEETKKGLIGLQAVMDLELADERHKRELVNQENEITRKWNRILAIALALIILLAIALAFALRKVSKINVELKKSNDLLADMNLQLATSNQKLGFANNKLQQFAFATGHDLKESLRNITSFTQLASIQMAEDVTGAQQHLQQAAAGGVRMRKMLDDLLHYTNIGGDASVIASFPLQEIISSVKQQLKEEIEGSRGDVHLVTPATIKADRMAIEQLFYNLVHNALRYVRADEPPRISIKVENRAKDLVFLVRDNGMGVSAEHRQDIFKPFHRLHDRMQSGSGLGLSICKKVVESYGGKIWYDSGDGNGSVFAFTIPAAEPKAQL